MSLNKIATKLTSKVLKDLQVKDWQRLTPELNNIITVALSKMYIKGRNHERDGIDWHLFEDGTLNYDK